MEIVVAGITVHLPDTVETRHGTVCMLAMIERGSREQWVRLTYRARGVKVETAEEDAEATFNWPSFTSRVPVVAFDDLIADDVARRAQQDIRAMKRLERELCRAGVALTSAYGGS